MKKVMILVTLLIAVLAVNAQTANNYVAFVADTTTNSETEYLVIDDANPIKYNYAVTITVKPVNASGTASVTAMPQGSLDGTNWYDLESSAVTVNNAGTVALKQFSYVNAYFRYYRVKLVSTGTGVTNFTGQFGLKN